MSAVEVACMNVERIEADDIGLIEQMLRDSRTWAYVDPLAIHVAGPILARHPS
jgi:hypothetical protein